MRLYTLCCAVCLLGLSANALAGLRLPGEDFTISKMIPKEGDTVKVGVSVLNEGPGEVKGSLQVICRAGPDNGDPREIARAKLPGAIAAGQRVPMEVTWKAPTNGWWRLTFALRQGGDEVATLVKRLAVVKSDVTFAWFGAPRDFRWCNVPTTVKEGDEGFWLKRGAIPCAWRGAECYKDWSVDRFVEHYGSPRWIAIDEIGGPGPSTDKFMQALKTVKQAHPDQFVAVWTMGAHKFWRDVQDRIDLFIPEIYLNYRGNHLGQFDAYFRTVREAGMMNRTIAGLGISVIKDEKTGQITCTPTKEDVLRQFRYLKRTVPEMPGIGFFTSDSAAPGVAEYADELCEQYFINPVLSIASNRLQITPPLGRPGSSAYARITVRNVGNMDCAGAGIALCRGTRFTPETVLKADRIPQVRAGGTCEVELRFDRPAGMGPVSAHILPAGEYTILDGDLTDVVVGVRDWPADQRLVVVPASDASRADAPAFAPAGAPDEVAREVAADGTLGAALPTASTAGGEVGWIMPGDTAAGQVRCFALGKAGATKAAAPDVATEGSRLTIATHFYRAVLDTAKDELVSLKAAGSETEILGSPWALQCDGHSGFGSPKTAVSGPALRVQIPFASATAEGESVYMLRSDAPYLEIARRFKPKGKVTLQYVGERCGLEQRGGTYALQAGVGAPVTRGKLVDGTEYRDLLFGYLGEGPGPGTEKKCGWLDMSFGEKWNAGLGVVIAERWADSASKVGYDVTRLYDASDWIEVPYLWNIESRIGREQHSRLFLIPHGYGRVAAQELWEAWQAKARDVR